METQINKAERIELRISAQDKRIFKKAQKLSGDKTFSSFVARVLKQEAEEIIAKHDRIITTERDREIFFNAVFGNQQPNAKLAAAAEKFKAKKS